MMEMVGTAAAADTGQDVAYDDAPIALIFADSDDRRMRAGEDVWSLGGRVAVSMPVIGAPERLADQVAASAVIVDIAADAGAPLEQLLDRIEEAAHARRFASVVTVPPALIDLAAARAGHPDIVLMCDPTPAERMAVIGSVLSRERLRLNDPSREAVLPRLQQLSEEVGRIAHALATLSGGETGARARGVRREADGTRGGGEPAIDASQVRAVIRARRLRDQYFSADLFADPAWDMLLDLTAARLERRQVAVSSLCIAAAVPPTTALRWIKTLTDQGIFVRIADPSDGRRVFIELSEEAAGEMIAYLAAAERMAATPI